MKLIDAFSHDSEMVPLIDLSRVDPSKNTYTVIVGKNGVGKSRFISRMANYFKEEALNNIYDHTINIFEKHTFDREIIAISTSPFDKFSPQNRTTPTKKI
ncbi:hypothetical protein EBI01_07485 [Marinomonas rhizomae]|uniref:Uncharacterized protein n=1 Tax=Marinomonas rhizomae TaxID=491948 RepID=A0A366JB23_9GAMM|nr:hypothetical protein [Marinomonas rhizomae]RBP83569.1 hypothetical protein DFP80_106219 [Marinomonas rhizomae]RNF74113.1 hypothetical protein EBI01_07485 [Marinomonas rhizomae]